MMKQFCVLISTLCMNMLVISTVLAETVNEKIHIPGKVPQGVVIHKNSVTVTQRYRIEKTSSSHAVARMRGGRGGITGEFDCTCNGSEGGCSVVTTPNSVTCAASGCSNCYMIVTIPGAPKTLYNR